MAKQRETHRVMCPYCHDLVDAELNGQVFQRAIVAHCYKTGQSCDQKKWGSPDTRFSVPEGDFGPDSKQRPQHVIQGNPPLSDEEIAELAEKQKDQPQLKGEAR